MNFHRIKIRSKLCEEELFFVFSSSLNLSRSYLQSNFLRYIALERRRLRNAFPFLFLQNSFKFDYENRK